MSTIRVFSYGGGVQSTAGLVLAAQGKIDFPTFLFCNVGEDSENPATLEYVADYAKPYARQHGIEFVELRRMFKGQPQTLMEQIHRTERSIHIPIRMREAGRLRRSCTRDFKINVLVRELKQRGATKENPAISALGISLDELHRMRTDSGIAEQKLVYPLVDLRLDRQECMNIISRAGLPVPPKSSCYFCPFHNRSDWSRMARDEPHLFVKAVELERFINDRLAKIGSNPGYLSSLGKPLDEAFRDNGQLAMFEEDDATCDIGGYCHA